ncbi:MAG: alanine--tRNA ligase-related protein [Clostridia bacterium]|nr:alanine--tRNA ligase-related protein [Clostridia bacterium]
MTEQIYYTDAYCKTFTATVLSCQPHEKNSWAIVLDRTAFYPEGGGQPGDIGTLNDIPVTDTHIKEGEILHYTAEPLEPGTAVAGVIDWNYRFDLMQNHSGEHIVSGIIHADTQANNVGFHMGKDVITIDFDIPVSPDKLQEYELLANEAVWADLTTEISYPDPQTLQELDYRSKKQLTGDVRIVTYPGYDVCACCGMHVQHTGEIGLIKLLSVQKHKTGSRIEMLCGRRALEYCNTMLTQNHAISVALSAKPFETAAAVQRLKDENSQLSAQISDMETAAFEKKAAALQDAGNVILFEDSLEPFSVRKLTVAVMETCGGRCAVFSGNDENGYKYAVGEKDGDTRALVKEMNKALHGRGGGKPFLAQGSIQAKRAEIEVFFSEIVKS